MKKMKGFTLVLLMFVLVLSACSSTGSETPAEPTPTSKVEATDPVESVEPTEPAQEKEEINLNGRVIRVGAWWDLKPAGGTASEKARLDKIAEIEAKYNFTFEWVNTPFEEHNEKIISSLLDGKPFLDIIQWEVKRALPAVLKGQLLTVDEFTDSTSNINNDANLMRRYTPFGGGEYGFDNPVIVGLGMHYNRDLIRELGLEDPKVLYENGQWTWDKFLELAKQATRDLDNDGKIDVYGTSGWPLDIFLHFVAANGGGAVIDGKEGFSDPRTMEAAEFVKRLYDEKVVQINNAGDPMDWNETNVFKEGKVAFFTAAEWNLSDLTFDMGVVPIPVGPSGSPDITYADTGASAKFIPKGVEDPHLVYRVFEESFDVPMFEDYYGQDYLESMYMHEDDITMMREHIAGTGSLVLHEAYPDYPVWGFVNDIVVNAASVAATVEAYKDNAQEAIDSLGAQ